MAENQSECFQAWTELCCQIFAGLEVQKMGNLKKNV